jgi:hypothetical protein
MLNARVSFAEGGYVPLGPSGVTVANSEFGCVYLNLFVCDGSHGLWMHGMHGYMAQFEWKFEWRSVRGTCRSGGAFSLGRRH